MLFSLIATAFAVGAVSLAATAAEPSIRAQPSDLAPKVSQASYRTTFVTYSGLLGGNERLAKHWRDSNADVAAEGMEGSADMSANLLGYERLMTTRNPS
jgi:hypothetical protein